MEPRPIHASLTCFVHAAGMLGDDDRERRVALKFMRHEAEFLREVRNPCGLLPRKCKGRGRGRSRGGTYFTARIYLYCE